MRIKTFLLMVLFAIVPNLLYAAVNDNGYIYTPLVRDGVMWKYVHSGMNYDYTESYVFETY
ncbi:MAG: hypothetical protein II271_00945, partial [Muribaculaceae bacterium]|nr:hypothetical protein [Muribaculaceae bacterium]